MKTGDKLTDRWATFYVYEHEGKSLSCACAVIMNTLMSDEQKLEDMRTRKDRYAFEKNKIVELISRARKKGRMREVIEKSLAHDGLEGDMFTMEAEVIGLSGTSVLVRLSAVTGQGIDAWQYFDKDEFQKRFRYEQTRENTSEQGLDEQSSRSKVGEVLR